MAYGDKMLKEAPEATIRAAIGTWTKIREDGKRHRQPDVVKTANRMLDKYEGELRRREECAGATTDEAMKAHLLEAALSARLREAGKL